MHRLLRNLALTFVALFLLLLCPKTVKGPTAEYSNPSSPTTVSPTPTTTPTEPKKTTFTIGGDIMLDRYVNHTFKSTKAGSSTAFAQLDSTIFANSDLRLANLEGPISPDPIDDNIDPNNLVFNFPPDTVAALQLIKLNAVSLANNHTSNKGKAGLENTRQALTVGKIQPIGQQYGFAATSVWRTTSGTLPVSIITINTLDDYDQPALITAIKQEKAAGQFVLVWPHWGNEYQTLHSKSQHELATSWITTGANLIIGGHPHVVQDSELINGVPVIYSLGNLVFDQYFSTETQQGLIVTGTLTEKTIGLTFHPVAIRKLQPVLMTASEGAGLIERVTKGFSGLDQVTVSGDTVTINR